MGRCTIYYEDRAFFLFKESRCGFRYLFNKLLSNENNPEHFPVKRLQTIMQVIIRGLFFSYMESG
jgi:hypothetical protein